MRLHSNILTEADVRDALDRSKRRGNVDSRVDFKILDARGSRTRARAFEVKLEWNGDKVKGDGRRWTNSGLYGADSERNGTGNYAATYEEWGWFIAELFDKDEHAVFGHYKGMDNFDAQTKNKFLLDYYPPSSYKNRLWF